MDFNRSFSEISHLASDHATLLRALALGSLTFFLLTPVLAPVLIILMPADILLRRRPHLRELSPVRRAVYLLWHIFKDVFGVALILLGVILLFMPGQGLLTIFAGVLLADIPGKRRLLRQLLSAGKVRPVVDRLRQRFHRPELLYPETGEE